MNHRVLWSCLAASLLAAPLGAQSWLQGPFSSYPQGAVQLTLAGDVSGDGLEDLVLLFDGQLPQLVLGLPGGEFGSATPIASTPWVPVRAAIGDLDGDGLADLALLHANKTQLAVLRADGGGALVSGFSATLPDQATGLALLDVDGDGALDIVAGRRGDSLALVLHNAGAFQFTPGADIPALAGATRLALADVDADGEPDLVSADSQGDPAGSDLAVTPGLGGGVFGALQSLATDDIHVLAVGDINGDGAADVIDAGENFELHVRHGGPGGLGPPGTMMTSRQVGGLAVADMNRDGLTDLVAALRDPSIVYETCQVNVWLQSPGGHLQSPRLWCGGDDPTELLAADFDHDGATDLLLGNGGHALVRGQGDGRPRNGFGFFTGPHVLLITDGDGDGASDLIVAESFSTSTVQIFPSRPIGSFAAPLEFDVGGEGRTVALGDLTGDGVPDGLTGVFGPGFSMIALNVGLGGGAYAGPVPTFDAFNPRIIKLGDVDGDGDLDAVVAASLDFPSNGLVVGRNDGAGGLTKVFGKNGQTTTRALALADVNDDGRQDVAVAGYAKSFVQYVAQADGTLLLGDSEFLGQTNEGVLDAIGYDDFDGDGLLDVILGNPHAPASSTVLVFRGAGDGSFTSAGSQACPANTGLFELVDIDGDGRRDLVFPDHYHDQLLVWPRLPGSGPAPWFGTPVTSAMPSVATALVAGDLDGDGAPDVALLHEDSGGVTVWHNLRGPWADLGHSLAGADGYSRLAGSGTLQPGSPTLLLAEHGSPLTPAILVVGFDQIDLPFKGGVLVPQPALLLPGLVTDTEGSLALAAPWPAGLPSDLGVVMQAWFGVPGGGAGLAASNGLRATTP